MTETCSGVRMCKLTWSGQKLKLGAAKIEVATPQFLRYRICWSDDKARRVEAIKQNQE